MADAVCISKTNVKKFKNISFLDENNYERANY